MTTIQWVMLISIVVLVMLAVKMIWFVKWLKKKMDQDLNEPAQGKTLRSKEE